jgi:PAS domain S-box-containing protein
MTVVFVLTFIMLFASRVTFLAGYEALERQDVLTNADRALHALRTKLDAFASTSTGYSWWDDTYAFVQDKNQAYIDANLYPETFIQYKIDLVVYFDTNRQPVFAQSVEQETGTIQPVPDSTVDKLKSSDALFAFAGLQDTREDIIVLDGKAMIVVTSNILTNDFKGPSKGTLVWGRYLDKSAIEELSDTTLLPIEIFPLETDHFPKTTRDVLLQSPDETPVSVNVAESDIVEGITLYKNLEGQPAIFIEFDKPRDIYNQGLKSLGNFRLLLLASGLIFSIVLYMSLRHTVLNPLARLSDNLNGIRARGNIAERLTVQGKDELAALGHTINSTLEALQRSQEKVFENESNYRRFYNQTPTMLFSIDSRTRIASVSDYWLASMGYERDEVIDKYCTDFMTDRSRTQLKDTLFPTLMQGSNVKDATVQFTKRNFDTIEVLFSAVPEYDNGGTVTGALVVLTDISERLVVEQRVHSQNEALIRSNRELAVARQQAEEAVRIKSEFLSTMSHELRTPLNAVIGYTQILLAGMSGDLNDEQGDFTNRILSNAKTLLNLINDILDLSKIEAGRIEIAKREFSLRDLLREVVYQTKGLADNKGLTLLTNIAPELPEKLVGDDDRLKQIVINLVSNAIKFTDHGIVAVNIAKPTDQRWEIAVTDTGIGIPLHAQEYIFDEFRQVDGSMQREHKGTGLGLAIVRKLSMLMGGNVRVKSIPGQGSTFTVILPLITGTDTGPVKSVNSVGMGA